MQLHCITRRVMQSRAAAFVSQLFCRAEQAEKPAFTPQCHEDNLLTARNKWLLAHADSSEAKQGAYVGLTGENINMF